MTFRRVAVALAFASTLACARDPSPADFPGMQLRARVETHLESRKESLREAPAHYALVFELDPRDLEDFMKQIQVFQDSTGFVLGVAAGPETHGGGLLALLLDHWRPDSRAARLDDRFWFEASRRSLALRDIYRGYQSQIFLPVPGMETAEIDGELPDSAQLARMRFRYGSTGDFVETDAYKFLGLLIAHQEDLASTWRNQLNQELSADRLLRNARGNYLDDRTPAAETSDDSRLHLVEILLAYDRRRGAGPAATEIKRRLLEVALAREKFEGDAGAEALGHTVESLGLLLDDPDVTWEPDERQRVLRWLRKLERDRFHDLDAAPILHLAHLARGLDLIEGNRRRLDPIGGTPSGL